MEALQESAHTAGFHFLQTTLAVSPNYYHTIKIAKWDITLAVNNIALKKTKTNKKHFLSRLFVVVLVNEDNSANYWAVQPD